jgi:purine-binding chemotaxis protein CheW
MDALVEPGAAGPPVLPDGGADSHQFVMFHVQDEQFAVPLAEVQEIIRMPDLVRVPLSPPALEGLANLRGAVLPVISLRDVFRFPTALHDDATRVVVLDRGRPVGLVVDRMANVASIDPERIESSAGIGGTVATDLLAGMIRGEDGRSMVMILDTGQVVHREFDGIASRAPAALGPVSAVHGRGADATAADEDHLVSFEVAGQEYAFPIERVQEIVQLPGHVTHVPKAAGHVIGVISLRDHLLPLVGLREMFNLPPAELTEANKVVVVSLGGLSVGVVMDSVKEVLRVDRSLVEPVPALLARDCGLEDVKAICRLQDGRRLVSVLSAERMFNVDEIRAEVGAGEEASMALDGAPGQPGAMETDDEEQFVVFRLMGEEYGVPIEAVQEIVRVPDLLTRIPKTPAFVEGVINLRGAVLPVVDQRRRFGMPDAERNDRQRIIVFTLHGVRTGFIVDSVSGVMRIPARLIGAVPDLSEEQRRLIGRVANIESQKRIVLLLDVAQMLDAREVEAVKGASA